MKRILISVTLFASLISSYAYSATYTYTGKYFYEASALYTTDMRVTATITTSSPIPPNSTNLDISALLTSWSVNDGIQTINNTNGVIYPTVPLTSFSTDASGNITAGKFSVFISPIGTVVGDTDDFISISSEFAAKGLTCVNVSISTGLCDTHGIGVGRSYGVAEPTGVWVSCVFEDNCPKLQINAGLNDAWYDPETSGQGFFITVFPDLNYVSLAWFTYDTELPPEDATANLGDPGHRWLTAGGQIDGNKVLMSIEMTSGGLFDTATEITRTDPPGSDGTIILTFDGCNSGTVEYDIPSITRQGSVPIQRVAGDNIALCEALNSK